MTAAQEFSIAVKELYEQEQKLPQKEQIARAKARLISSGLIDENGEFTDPYAYSREYRKKNKDGKAAL